MSLHRYLYANANPINYCDPSGEFIGVILAAIQRAYVSSVAMVSYTGFVIATKANVLFFQLTNAIRMGQARILNAINGTVELGTRQAARINTIKEIAHNWKVRNTLSGDVLDAGHIEKIQNGIRGLERSVAVLRNGLNRPGLNRATRKALEEAIEEAETLINAAKEVLGG
jgi:hypothetical protein